MWVYSSMKICYSLELGFVLRGCNCCVALLRTGGVGYASGTANVGIVSCVRIVVWVGLELGVDVGAVGVGVGAVMECHSGSTGF